MNKLGMFICWRRGFRLKEMRDVFPGVPEEQLLAFFTDVVNEYFESDQTLFSDLKLADFVDLPEYFHKQAGKKAAEGFPERLAEYEKRFAEEAKMWNPSPEFYERSYDI